MLVACLTGCPVGSMLEFIKTLIYVFGLLYMKNLNRDHRKNVPLVTPCPCFKTTKSCVHLKTMASGAAGQRFSMRNTRGICSPLGFADKLEQNCFLEEHRWTQVMSAIFTNNILYKRYIYNFPHNETVNSVHVQSSHHLDLLISRWETLLIYIFLYSVIMCSVQYDYVIVSLQFSGARRSQWSFSGLSLGSSKGHNALPAHLCIFSSLTSYHSIIFHYITVLTYCPRDLAIVYSTKKINMHIK